MELSNGRVSTAISLYQRIVMEFASDRSLVAKALIRLGAAQEALGSTEATRAYQRIVSYYPDQREQVIVARSRLAALSTETVGGGNGGVRRVLQPAALCSDQSDDAIATFEDANLEVRVRSALLISAQEDLTCGLLSGLTRLAADAAPYAPALEELVERGLDYEYAEIESLVGIHNLTSLTYLHLYNNSITDISALSGLTSLPSLGLGGNSISDNGALSGLTSLTNLRLNDNPNLTDIQPLLDNTGIGAGDLVYLKSTNVSCTDVAALRGKGVTVSTDCP